MNKDKKMEALVSAYQKSGMGAKEFSTKHGVSLYQLKYWVKKLGCVNINSTILRLK